MPTPDRQPHAERPLNAITDLRETLAELELRLGDATTAASNPARLGVTAATLEGGRATKFVARRAHEPFPAASTIKVFVLQALMEGVAAGRHALTTEIELRASDQVPGTGVLKVLSPGRAYTLLDLATLMIVVSDNTATNLLIDLLGVAEVNRVTANHGWTGTALSGKLQQAGAPGSAPRSLSVTTPADLADYFGKLWLGELLPPHLTTLCQQIYRRQQYGELGRALDYDPYSVELGAGRLNIASKSGSLRGVRNDAGVLEPARGEPLVVLAVMTSGCPDERFHSDNLGARVVGEAAALVYARRPA